MLRRGDEADEAARGPRTALAVLVTTAVAWPLSLAAEQVLSFEILAIDGLGHVLVEWVAEAFAARVLVALSRLLLALPAEWLARSLGLAQPWREVCAVLIAAATGTWIFELLTAWPLSGRERIVIAALSLVTLATFTIARAGRGPRVVDLASRAHRRGDARGTERPA